MSHSHANTAARGQEHNATAPLPKASGLAHSAKQTIAPTEGNPPKISPGLAPVEAFDPTQDARVPHATRRIAPNATLPVM